jgi:DNA-binding MarR family transcriptional regulator
MPARGGGIRNYFKLEVSRLPGAGDNGDNREVSGEVLAPGNLPYRMRLLVQSMTRRFQGVLDPFDITPLHWGILSCLWREDGLPTRTISRQLDQLGGTVTVGLDAMEKRGLVRRRPDREDGRVSRVYLSKKGAALEKQLVPAVEALTTEMFACFSTEQAAQLSALVDRLRTHIDA